MVVFCQLNGKAPHPWFLVTKPGGVVSPGKKARCRSLTVPERARIEANRLAALKRQQNLRTVTIETFIKNTTTHSVPTRDSARDAFSDVDEDARLEAAMAFAESAGALESFN